MTALTIAAVLGITIVIVVGVLLYQAEEHRQELRCIEMRDETLHEMKAELKAMKSDISTLSMKTGFR